MTLLGPNTDYTDKDFDALVARVRNLILGVFPEWTDGDAANFGNITVEMFCFVGDILTKYQDNQAAEAYLQRATQRKNILALCKQIGFTPRGNTAALVDLEVRASPTPIGSVTIPARSRVRTEAVTDPVVFETMADLVIPAGSPAAFTTTGENAQRKSELFTTSGKANYEIRLALTPFLDGSLQLVAGNGEYTVVEQMLESNANDRHCTVTVDQNDRATVRFGNGVNGAIPAGTITATYKVGGGAKGRVEANTVKRFDGAFVDSFGNTVTLIVTNPNPSTAAQDRMTSDEIRVAGPRSLRVLTRTVAREDYEINAMKVPGVARALMLTSDQDAVIDENAGALFVVPIGGGLPTQETKDAVLQMVTVTYPNTLTFACTVYDPVYLVVNIVARVYLKKGAVPAAVKKNVVDALTAAFAITTQGSESTAVEGIDFGYNLRDADGNLAGSIAWSDVFNIVRDATGVRKIDDEGLTLNGESDDLPIEPRQFPILGTVVVINADSNATI